MKSRSLLFAMVLAVVGTFQVAAQSVQEKVPFTLSGIWQMCFYRSSQPGIPGELKTGNTLKILSDDGRFSNVVMMPTGAIVIGYGCILLIQTVLTLKMSRRISIYLSLIIRKTCFIIR